MSLEITINKTEFSRINSFAPENIIFGRIFTDHMFSATYKDGKWQNPKIEPYGNISVSPALSALHYGQSIFEGMKAFKNKEGNAMLFRPKENHKRLNVSAERMCMPSISEDMFMEGLKALVDLDKNWIPDIKGSSLYIRPFMFSADDYLGVKPADNYKFMIYCCPVNAYYNKPLKVKIEEKYTRAAPGGVGFAKAAGNYAAAMLPTKIAQSQGYDQVLWTDGRDHYYLEELGTSNVFVVTGEGIYTPNLDDTLLAGITRDSIITLLKDWGMNVIEKPISTTDLLHWIEKGELKEMFVSGTAATVINIKTIGYKGADYEIPISDNPLTKTILEEFYAIRTGLKNDDFGWMEKV